MVVMVFSFYFHDLLKEYQVSILTLNPYWLEIAMLATFLYHLQHE